ISWYRGHADSSRKRCNSTALRKDCKRVYPRSQMDSTWKQQCTRRPVLPVYSRQLEVKSVTLPITLFSSRPSEREIKRPSVSTHWLGVWPRPASRSRDISSSKIRDIATLKLEELQFSSKDLLHCDPTIGSLSLAKCAIFLIQLRSIRSPSAES